MGNKINKPNAARLLARAGNAYALVPYPVGEGHLAAGHWRAGRGGAGGGGEGGRTKRRGPERRAGSVCGGGEYDRRGKLPKAHSGAYLVRPSSSISKMSVLFGPMLPGPLVP